MGALPEAEAALQDRRLAGLDCLAVSSRERDGTQTISKCREANASQ